MTLFELTVEGDLEVGLAREVLAALEEVLGKYNLDLDDAEWDYV